MTRYNIINIFRDSLLKNSLYLITTNFVTSVLGFFFWIIAARYYTPTDIGTASAIFSSTALISMIASISLYRGIMFYLPRDKNNTNKIIDSCILVNIISSIVLSVIFILGLRIWVPDLTLILNNVENILIFMIITTVVSVSGIIGSTFTAQKRSSFQMLKEATYHFIKMFPLFFFINFGAMGILASVSIGLILSTILGFILLFKVWRYIPRIKIDPIIKSMAKFSIGNYIADIIYNLPKSLLPIAILNTISAKSAGYFYIAMMVASLFSGVSAAISSSLLVEFDKYNVNKAIKFNFILLIPGLLLLVAFGKFMLNIFNPLYAENATMTMILLALSSIPLSSIIIFNTVRNAQNRVLSVIKMNIVVTSMVFIFSIPLIKIMDIEGVAIAYLLANTIGAILVVNRLSNPKEFILKLLKDIKNYSV